jgi:hypothetical protein
MRTYDQPRQIFRLKPGGSGTPWCEFSDANHVLIDLVKPAFVYKSSSKSLAAPLRFHWFGNDVIVYGFDYYDRDLRIALSTGPEGSVKTLKLRAFLRPRGTGPRLAASITKFHERGFSQVFETTIDAGCQKGELRAVLDRLGQALLSARS